MIRIVNIKNYRTQENEVLVKVDRTSVLGNPFFMKDESKRDEVCDKYKNHFNSKVYSDMRFIAELNRIRDLIRSGKSVALACWCFPKRCHAETIKNFLEVL